MKDMISYIAEDAMDLISEIIWMCLWVLKLAVNIIVWTTAIVLTCLWIGFLFSSVVGAIIVLVFAPLGFFIIPMALVGFTFDLRG
jgi:hypothetical protein